LFSILNDGGSGGEQQPTNEKIEKDPKVVHILHKRIDHDEGDQGYEQIPVTILVGQDSAHNIIFI
jgi:hypothetical protein